MILNTANLQHEVISFMMSLLTINVIGTWFSVSRKEIGGRRTDIEPG